MRPVSRQWVAVAHPEGDAPRGLCVFEAAGAGCAAAYLRAWLSVHAPALDAAAVWLNGAPFVLYPSPPPREHRAYQSRRERQRQRQANRRRSLAMRRYMATQRAIKHKPPG